MQHKTTDRIILVVGDFLTAVIVTLYGFASHNRLETAGAHMLTTLIPVVLAWVLVGVHVRVFDMAVALDGRQLWRPFWAMILAAPLAAFLRAAWLNGTVAPIFVVVLGGVSALGLLAWRTLFWGYGKWRKRRAS